MRHLAIPAVVLALGTLSLSGCDRSTPLALEEASTAGVVLLERSAGTHLSPELCALDRGDFTLNSENDFFPLGAGSVWEYQGEEDGALVELRITVLDETEVVGGVVTRVLEEREWEDGELIEVSRNFFAETSEETVCYFGEDVDIYEDGEVVSHEGAWRADAPGNAPGIIMPADPRPGMTFAMESAPGIAEDAGKIVGTGPVEVPAGAFRETIRVRETNPLDGGSGYKIFAEDVGLVVDESLQLVRYRVADDGDDGDDDDDDDGDDDDVAE